MKKYVLTLVAALSLGVLAQTAMAKPQLEQDSAISATQVTTQAKLRWFAVADGTKHEGYLLSAGKYAILTPAGGWIYLSGTVVGPDMPAAASADKSMPSSITVKRQADIYTLLTASGTWTATLTLNDADGTPFTKVAK